MRKLFIGALLAAALSGCTSLQKLENLYTDVSGSTVSPQGVYVAANAFDAIKATATQYFTYCRANLATTPCSAANRRFVLKWVRSGTAARKQAETYLVAGTPAPTQIFQTLVAAVDALKTSAAASGVVQ